ncbi:MAG: cyclic nucleotide-binding and patatin-like phospholipase domain-containing protein [Rubripirellula sp.]|jgi:predicted acylesterase/phospholipase RssA|nr:cyclic nucleotide-binding domain-containing protein [Planctomycetaceae bacterium]MDF1844469.1 cyclic nucleotide-binding and patatin-like phospholipase domain-containing protein [Rubripirellula sp.]
MTEISEQADHDYKVTHLKRLSWSKGVSDAAIQEIANVGEYVQVQDGEFVHRAEDKLTEVFFVISGRLRATALDLFGKQVLVRPLLRGAVFGLFSIAQPEQANTSLVATEPSTGIRLGIKELLALMSQHPDLQMSLYRLAANIVRQIVMVDRSKEKPSVVGVVHQSPASRPLTPRLVKRLMDIENPPCVAGDDPNWQQIEGIPYRLLFENGKILDSQQRRAQLKEWADHGRVFIDLDTNHDLAEFVQLFSFVDTILWCVRPQDTDAAKQKLSLLQNKVPGWHDKICLVWLLDGEENVSPLDHELSSFVDRDFKISFSEPKQNYGRQLKAGFERIIHHLRGIQIGLALGGGAARGMAHLGVLSVLEENGIYVDMIAGTSAGAMAGTLYASGMDAEHTVQCFKNDLTLPWPFRMLPGGAYWYLVYKYRRGQFDSMLRKYLADCHLEQLPIPMLTVTVDLVRGGPVVRHMGDATHGILESINLPGLSAPIIRNGEALVDGGLVNNIPADVLVSKGCNFVIASSVTAQLEREFVGIRADQEFAKHKNPSLLKVIMRGYLVQSFNMNSVGVQPADFVIEPDVTAFDLAEFSRADEMAKIGEQVTLDAVTSIKQQLAKLDKDLFPLN